MKNETIDLIRVEQHFSDLIEQNLSSYKDLPSVCTAIGSMF